MFQTWIKFSRPFTLIAPMLGVVSGALTAYGSAHSPYRNQPFRWEMFWLIAIASLAAGWLNAASNGVNQIYDLEIDRVNKPNRPLVDGSLSLRAAWWLKVVSGPRKAMRSGRSIERHAEMISL